jgi:hypothetical protein
MRTVTTSHSCLQCAVTARRAATPGLSMEKASGRQCVCVVDFTVRQDACNGALELVGAWLTKFP